MNHLSKHLSIPVKKAKIQNEYIDVFIDTGATVSLIAHTLVNEEELRTYTNRVEDANGNPINIVGSIDFKLETPNGSITEEVLVYKKQANAQIDLLLGMNILSRSNIDFPRKKVNFMNCEKHDTKWSGLKVKLLKQ